MIIVFDVELDPMAVLYVGAIGRKDTDRNV